MDDGPGASPLRCLTKKKMTRRDCKEDIWDLEGWKHSHGSRSEDELTTTPVLNRTKKEEKEEEELRVSKGC